MESSKFFIFERLVVFIAVFVGYGIWLFWTGRHKNSRNRSEHERRCLRFYYRVRQLNESHNSITRFHRGNRKSIRYFSPQRNAKEYLEDFDHAVEILKEEFSDVVIDHNDWTRFALSQFNKTRTILLADLLLEELESEILAKPADAKGKH